VRNGERDEGKSIWMSRVTGKGGGEGGEKGARWGGEGLGDDGRGEVGIREQVGRDGRGKSGLGGGGREHNILYTKKFD